MTTVADAGCAGWRNFEDFKQRVIDRSKTRILAFLNIVGNGMRGGKFEQNLADMEAKPTADMARKYKDVVVGVKTAHYAGPEWAPVERGRGGHDRQRAGDGGLRREPSGASARAGHEEARPGDIYTHVYPACAASRRSRQPGTFEGRKRGVIFDVGHGGGSFLWRIAVPAMKEGFAPTRSDRPPHRQHGQWNEGHPERHGQVPAMGMPLDDVIARAWNLAREIKQDGLGHLSVGADRRHGVAGRARAVA